MVLLLTNYEFDEKNGIIKDKATGERCFIVYKNGMEAIFKGLSRIFDSRIDILLRESSLASSKNIAEAVRKKGKNNVKLLLSAYTERFAQNGFGRLEISEFDSDKAIVRIRVWNNLFAEMRQGESTYCRYLEGMFSGLYEDLFHASPVVKEVKCIGKRDTYCEFLLAPNFFR